MAVLRRGEWVVNSGPAVLLLVVLIVSQRRRARAMEEFQASVGVGDEIITTSGLYGRILASDDTASPLTSTSRSAGSPRRFAASARCMMMSLSSRISLMSSFSGG